MNFVVYGIVILEYMSFFYTVFRKQLRENLKDKITWSGIIVLIFTIEIFLNCEIEISIALGMITSIVVNYMFFETSFPDAIKLFLVAFPTLSILETIVSYIFKIVLNLEEAERTIGYMICIIIAIWLYYIIWGKKLAREAFQISGRIWGAISAIMCIIVAMISYFTYVLTEIIDIKQKDIGIFLVTAGGMIIFILNYVLIYYFNTKQKYQLESDLLEQYKEQQREYFEKLLQKEQKTKQFRHDIISDLLQIQNFCNKNEYEQAKQYVSEMLKDISVISKENYDVGNEIINVILNSYFDSIKETSDIKVKGFVCSELSVSERDLCVVVSNLVKNAVEAVENNVKKEKKIVFEVNQGKQFLYIKVMNTVENQERLIGEGIPDTSKKDKDSHGFGVRNVIAVAEKYKGSYSYKVEDGYYIAEVYLRN